jgi:hypothetical protein
MLHSSLQVLFFFFWLLSPLVDHLWVRHNVWQDTPACPLNEHSHSARTVDRPPGPTVTC